MIPQIHSRGWRFSSIVLTLCVLFGLVSACNRFGKKDEPDFEPGIEWIVDMRERIDEDIENPEKQTRMFAVVDQVEIDLTDLDRVVQKLYRDLANLTDDYHSTREDYRKTIAEFEAGTVEVRDRIIERRFKMRDLSTPEDWEKLTDYRERKGLYRQSIRPLGQ
jgi:hypothetical protein